VAPLPGAPLKDKSRHLMFDGPSAGGEGVEEKEESRRDSKNTEIESLGSLRNDKHKWRRLSKMSSGRRPSMQDLQEFNSNVDMARGSTTCRMSIMTRTLSLMPSKEEIRLQPTYRLDPIERVKPNIVYRVVDNILEAAYEGEPYDIRDIKELTKGVTNEIKDQIQHGSRPCRLGPSLPDRTKLVVQVFCGQRTVGPEKRTYDLRLTSRCIWRASFDQFVEVSYQNKDLWVVALVFFYSVD